MLPVAIVLGALHALEPGHSKSMMTAFIVAIHGTAADRVALDDGVDDGTEIWWDPKAKGITELGTEGVGMWRYVNGGDRILPGSWPEEEPNVFDPEGTVTTYEEPPKEAELPDYEPLPGS